MLALEDWLIALVSLASGLLGGAFVFVVREGVNYFLGETVSLFSGIDGLGEVWGLWPNHCVEYAAVEVSQS